MRGRDELEEDGTVDGHVAAYTEPGQREEDGKCGEGRRAARREAKDTGNEEGEVEADPDGSVSSDSRRRRG
jgi:hypothetical protein